MHILYLDDSGSVKNAEDKHIILAGVSVFERVPHWRTRGREFLAIGGVSSSEKENGMNRLFAAVCLTLGFVGAASATTRIAWTICMRRS